VEDAGRVRLSWLALIEVANVFPHLAAIGPNMVLNEPGEVGWEGWIELSAVNSIGEILNHPQAPFLCMATGPIGMVELVVVQNPGPVEEVVDRCRQLIAHSGSPPESWSGRGDKPWALRVKLAMV
jgi:hypothetical protein